MKKSFDKGKYHKTNPQTTVFERKRKKLMVQLENAKTETEKSEVIKQIKLLEHRDLKFLTKILSIGISEEFSIHGMPMIF